VLPLKMAFVLCFIGEEERYDMFNATIQKFS
jgi:hypothetical protein